MIEVLGLDIGGANLKAAHTCGVARSASFALWRDPAGLTDALRGLLTDLPAFDAVALTMTGELCDCFASQADGVRRIVASIQVVAATKRVRVWTLDGIFVSDQEALARPSRVAAANWLAQAFLAARLVPEGSALLVDIGSTTTDIVPLSAGRPCPSALTDPDRLACNELVYTGWSRTPVCAVLGAEVAAEWFATMADVYQVLGLANLPADQETADGRPATAPNAHARLARMLCADPAVCPAEITLGLARRARDRQQSTLLAAMDRVSARLPSPAQAIVVSGSGGFVLEQVRSCVAVPAWLSLAQRWGQEKADSACAWAVACLAQETG